MQLCRQLLFILRAECYCHLGILRYSIHLLLFHFTLLMREYLRFKFFSGSPFFDLPKKTSRENANSPYCSPYISYGTSKENLSKYQDLSLFSPLKCLNK